MEAFLLTRVLSTGTVVLDVLVIGAIIYLVVQKLSKKPLRFPPWLTNNALFLSFLLGLSGVVFSLLYSDVIGFTPCNLCWYQRIFMYSLTIILGIAWANKDTSVKKYAIPLAVLGLLVGVYHYVLQLLNRFGMEIVGCSTGTVDCAEMYFYHYGYISMPVMAITVFISITLLLSVKRKD